MSIVSSIRDYVEFLNTLSDSFGNQITSSKFITETCYYFLKTFQYSVFYIFSLEWLRDFTLLPITIPQVSRAIFSEHFFLESPGKVFFEFLEIPSLDENKFILGFFNSFFLTLPITVTHIIAVRRLLIQGIPAGFFSFLGYLVGQTFFIFCVIFGLRGILIPWLSLEPFNYIIGFIVLLLVVYTLVEENLIVLSWNKPSHKIFFAKFFLINFILSWCEQSCIFQYFSNITLSGDPSILEGFSTKTSFTSFLSHGNYILGLLFGSIIFSVLWAFFLLQLKKLIVSLPQISLTSFSQTVNKTSFFIVLAFTLTSIPFYSLEYIFAGPLGFISQDKTFQNTILSQQSAKDPLAFLSGTENQFLNIDVSSFDRGDYLLELDDSEVYSFEDLNYRGEMDWVTRSEKQSSITESKASFLSLTKIFKMQKDRSVNKTQVNSTTENFYQDANSLYSENENFVDDELSTLDDRFRDFDAQLINSSNSVNSSESLDDIGPLTENFKIFNNYSFSTSFFHKEPGIETNIEKNIKQKYYSNPIYQNLLALDIDLFLNRQPKDYNLKSSHEFDLYEKRNMLTSYYDSLREYSKLPYLPNFENFFDGTKSFTNKVYNQQFKGTLESLRRLFSLSKVSTNFLSNQTGHLDSVLKYDQPLYQSQSKFSSYHEEVPKIQSLNENIDQETLDLNIKQFTLNDSISKPLYAGWDENLRKFVITNKLFPRFSAGSKMTLPQEWSTKFTNEKKVFIKQK